MRKSDRPHRPSIFSYPRPPQTLDRRISETCQDGSGRARCNFRVCSALGTQRMFDALEPVIDTLLSFKCPAGAAA